MKKLLFPIAILLTALLCLTSRKNPGDNRQTINPVLGDISFVSKFGFFPDANTDEILRIKTHLEYVETYLRNKDVTNLSPERIQNRKHLLDLLHQYRTAGIFPRNYDYADQRKPCFIDKEGRICAVGYLVEQTAGREAAEQINHKYKYEEVLTMNDKNVDDWIAGSGLTKKECAMIQPAYGGWPGGGDGNHISAGYGISSSVLGGTNIAISIINGIKVSKDSKNKTIAIVGLATGATQVMIGALGMPPKIIQDANTNKSKRALAGINIGIGAGTMILSTWNLLKNKKHKENRTSWNVYSFPVRNNNSGLAVSFSKRF
jgi:hypothetical protein